MVLITRNQPNLDLSKQAKVTRVWCSLSKGTILNDIVIHLSCKEGDEQTVIDNLPKWVSDEMKITKSHTHVFLRAKQI